MVDFKFEAGVTHLTDIGGEQQAVVARQVGLHVIPEIS